VCLGLPGALPVLNRRAVELAIRAALGLGCSIRETSSFERKNYFYPDLPKGYQITQFEKPLAAGGALAWRAGRRPVRIRQVHLEEDAGRSIHDRFPHRTAIDLNRAGMALIEVVTEPELHDPAAARLFLTRLRRLLRYLAVSDCDLEKGSMRVDVNVSVRRRGERVPGTRTEVKNLNSFGNVERALRYEIARQVRVLEAGGELVAETLLWDAQAGVAKSMRSKEDTDEYRYFPEPDLPQLQVSAEHVRRVAATLPELPWDREQRFRSALGLPAYDAQVLTADPAVADYFEAVAGSCGDAKAASNWVMTEVLAWRNERGEEAGFPLPPERLAALIALVAAGRISHRVARQVFAQAAETGLEPGRIVAERGWLLVSDAAALAPLVDAALAQAGAVAARFLAGEERLLDYFVGQVLRASAGRADPQRVAELLRARARR
jgi:aspartyl-tRNA(Asn)/glutamyl-tRNA(Gln) amidotransferase subunit B